MCYKTGHSLTKKLVCHLPLDGESHVPLTCLPIIHPPSIKADLTMLNWTMWNPRTALAVAAMTAAATAGVVAATPTPAAAQDCGRECHECGVNDLSLQGSKFGGSYNMHCPNAVKTLCDVCSAPNSVSDIAQSALAIVREIESASIEDLRRLVATHSDRILLHAPRRLLAIRGSACSDDVTAVVFLSSRLTSALARIGVPALTQQTLQPQSQ